MKRIFALLLVCAMCVGFCACGNKDIELTLENYSDYLTVKTILCTPIGTEDAMFVGNLNNGYGVELDDGSTTFYLYKQFDLQSTVKGTSTNFIYNNVNVTLKITGNYSTFAILESNYGTITSWTPEKPIEKTMDISCDVAGAGSVSDTVVPQEGAGYVHDDKLNYTCEVVAVSGTVTPVS